MRPGGLWLGAWKVGMPRALTGGGGGGDSLYRWYRWLVEEAQLRRLEHDSEQAEESAGRKRFVRER